MSTNKKIARSAAVIAVATLCSRILGLIRDVVIARLFGVYIYAQAFVIALRIPNLLRDLVAEGAANAALVPVFTEYALRHSKEEFWELANVVLNVLLVVLMALTLAGVFAAPAIVRLIAPGFAADAEKLAITIALTRMVFPYILLISLAAYAMGLLNSLRHFVVPAFAPCLLNVSLIVCALLFGEGTRGLASGVLIGGLLQLCVQLPVLYRKGFRLRPVVRFRHPALKTIGGLLLPRLGSTAVYQLNTIVDSMFGSLAWIVGEGGVAILYFSYRMIQFPLGIFSTALSQAILPVFSTQALEEDKSTLTHTLSWGLRSVCLVMLPASAGFMVLSRQIVEVLFQGGRFDAYSATMTAQALFFYSIGLCAYGANKVVQSCFFALKDTWTPARIAAFGFVLNVVLNVLLMYPLKVGGLALATSLSGIISCALLCAKLNKRIKGLALGAIAFSFMKMSLASLGMAAVCFFVSRHAFLPLSGGVGRLAHLAVAIAAGGVSYAAFCWLLRIEEARQLFRWLVLRQQSGPRPFA